LTITALIKLVCISVNCIEGFVLEIVLGAKQRGAASAVNYDVEFRFQILG
jgi:hypothetical protein